MTIKTLKTRVDGLVLSLHLQNKLSATEFFKSARASSWGKPLDGQLLVEQYNEALGRAFGRGALTIEQVNRAMQP